jgi:hypothetical protein
VDKRHLNSFTPVTQYFTKTAEFRSIKLALHSAKNVELEHEKVAAWGNLNIYTTQIQYFTKIAVKEMRNLN